MADRRAISSDIWDSSFFGETLSLLGDLVWVGLITRCADNQGRMEDKPTVIRSRLFPYRDNITTKEIDDILALMGEDGCILRYLKGGKEYIQLVNWWEHQPLQYATPSNFPPPDQWKDRYRTFYKGHKIIFNWKDMVDTQEGIDLWNKLSILARISTWTTYLDTLKYNPNPNPNPLNINKNINGADAPRPASVSPKKAPENHTTRKALQKQFLILTGLPEPRIDTQSQIKAVQKLWWTPLDEMLDLSGQDVDRAVGFLKVCQQKLSGVTVSDPNSFIKTYRAVYAEQNNHTEPQYAERS